MLEEGGVNLPCCVFRNFPKAADDDRRQNHTCALRTQYAGHFRNSQPLAALLCSAPHEILAPIGASFVVTIVGCGVRDGIFFIFVVVVRPLTLFSSARSKQFCLRNF